MNVRIGYEASAEQFGPRGLLKFSVEAEDRGLDIVAVYDHFQPWRHQVAHIAPYLDLGFTDLVPHGPGGDRRRFLGQFTTDVLPGLRERAGHSALTTTGSSA